MKKFRSIAIILALTCCILLAFAGCTQLPEEEKDTQTVNPSDEVTVPDDENNGETAASGEEVNEEIPEVPDEPVIPEFINKLTGLETTEELANIRPVAIMINNIKKATPQQGISHADVIYEVLAEGGITRLLCLFTDYASLPETGSVRSARDYYIDLSDAHDAIYVHCGTSPQADSTLAARKTENMNGIYFDTPFYRNQWRKKNMGTEHSLMTTGELLVKGIEQKGYRTDSDAKQPLTFALADAPIENGEPAEYSSLKFSYYAISEFEYDSEAGVYNKKQYGTEHIDSNNNQQLTFENVIMLFCEQGMIKGDTAGRLYVNFFGKGDGYYMTDGAYKKIKWVKETRTSPYTLYEEDGETELVLNPGKTYIAVAPMDAEAVFE